MRSYGRTAVSLSALAGLALTAAAWDFTQPRSDEEVTSDDALTFLTDFVEQVE